MRAFRGWAILSICAVLSACGTRVGPGDGGDVVSSDRVTPLPDSNPPPPDGNPPPPDGEPPMDAPPPPPDGEPPMDVPPPPPDGDLDVPLPPPDGTPPDTIVEDIPIVPDAPPVDVPLTDGGPLCPNGITNTCPAATPGPCADLSDGTAHTVTFTGLTNTLMASCEGAMTGVGPDGVVPLTLTAPQDVTITAMPTGADAVVLAVFSGSGCNVAASELRCSNSSATMTGVARVQLRSLAAGTYWVMVASARGNPAIVQATLTAPAMRLMGDVCPGVTVVPDGAVATLSTAMFAPDADYGTTCSGGGTTGHVDAVFQYTLTTARDVTINVNATGFGPVSVDVDTMCGMRSTALPGCVSANPATRRFRNQAPGTYYITVDYMGAPGRTLVAQVTTAAPTMSPPADRCPGVALTAATASTVDVSTLGADYALTCLGGSRADAVYNFAAPAAGNDVIVDVAAPGGSQGALQLQSTCGTTNVGPCVVGNNATAAGGARSEVWQRYSGLSAGATYSAIAATTATMGTMSTRYYSVPAATSMAVTGNDRCVGAVTIPETGGVFTGSTATFNTDAMATCAFGCAPGGVDAIYRLTLTARHRVLASTRGSAFDTVLFINQGVTCPGTAVMGACNDDYYGNASGVLTTLDPGTYWIVVSGCGGTARGNYTLDVAVLPP